MIRPPPGGETIGRLTASRERGLARTDIEVDGYHPKTSRNEWGLAVSGLLLVLALVALGGVGVSRARELRCYSLDPPLSQTAQSMMAGQSFVCLERRCRVVFKLMPQRGLACFFGSPVLWGERASAVVQRHGAHYKDHPAGGGIAQGNGHISLDQPHRRGRIGH